jgi:hypothetical protein
LSALLWVLFSAFITLYPSYEKKDNNYRFCFVRLDTSLGIQIVLFLIGVVDETIDIDIIIKQ